MTPNRMTYRIQEIASTMGDAPFGSSLKNTDYTSDGVLIVQGKNIAGRRCDWSDRRYTSRLKYEALSRSQCQTGDIIFPKVGTIGKVGLLTPCPGVHNYLLSTNTMFLRTDETLAARDYVYYYFAWPRIVNLINALNSKSVQPVFNFTSLKNFPIELPPLPEQRAIAHILGTLDDKIDLNRRMNQTLEAIAQALFKKWFIDPAQDGLPKGWRKLPLDLGLCSRAADVQDGLPKGWRKLPLPDVVEVNPPRSLRKGQTAPYLDMGNMPTASARTLDVFPRDFGSGMRFIDGDTLVARITPCLENGKTCFVDFLGEGVVGWGSTEYIVLRPKPPLPTQFAYFLARSEDFRTFAISNMTGTSGRQRVPADCLNHFTLAVPPAALTEEFGRFAKTAFAHMKARDEESHTLTQLRDTLLPKLLSGELRIRDAEKFLEHGR